MIDTSVVQIWHFCPAIVLNVVPETSIVSFLVAKLHHSPLIVLYTPSVDRGTSCNKNGLMVELCRGWVLPAHHHGSQFDELNWFAETESSDLDHSQALSPDAVDISTDHDYAATDVQVIFGGSNDSAIFVKELALVENDGFVTQVSNCKGILYARYTSPIKIARQNL